MKRLAVFVHFDSTGEVAPHVQHTLREVQSVADHVAIVTTAKLTDSGREILGGYGEVIERENVGYDFMSYKAGLDSVNIDDFDEAFIINDSCVGPVIPMATIFDRMKDQPFDAWGMTKSYEIREHIQSYFVVFRHSALTNPAVRDFWENLQVLDGRQAVIEAYEIGLSRVMKSAGLLLGAYYQPTLIERLRCRWRLMMSWYSISSAAQLHMVVTHPFLKVYSAINPTAGMADLILRDGRLPMLKLSTLRHDPYKLGADQLLRLCEAQLPEFFVGVRDYLMRYGDFRNSLEKPLLGRGPAHILYGADQMKVITQKVNL